MSTIDSGNDEQLRFNDEVSLRDLYLILKKGALWIVLAAVAAGAVAFVYFSVQPDVYTAESTTLVTPLAIAPSLNVGAGDSLRVAEGVTVQYETYQTLANSRPVIEAVIQQIPAYDGGLRALERSTSLERLLGPANPGQSVPLAVTHMVSNQSPELAAELADAWAEATLAVVRESILDDLRPMREATAQALETSRAALEEIELELRDFRAGDDIAQRQGQNDAAVADLIAAEQRLRTLENLISIKQAEREGLMEQVNAEQLLLTTTDLASTEFFTGMTLEEASAFVGLQLGVARTAHTDAQEALNEFGRTNNLDLLTLRQENLESQIAADTFSLLNLDSQIELAEAGLAAQLAELELQPERLLVVQSLLDDSALIEGSRNQADPAVLDELAQLTLFAEELNPHHQSLTSQVLSSRLSIADFEAQQVALADSLAGYESALQEVRSQRAALLDSQLQLELTASEARAEYDALADSSMRLALASRHPDAGALTLASGTGAAAQLRTQVREVDLELVNLRAEHVEIQADIGELNLSIAEHRAAIAELNQAQAELDREVDLRSSAFDNVAVVQPLLEFFGELAPGNARIMTEAVTPEEPEGGRLLPTVIAAIVAGLLATVFVFLREAVRDPAPAIRPRATAVGAASPSTD